ncbi:MAG: hypothetical protein ACTSU2_01820 [Promethearchaeota archaeon]
MTTVADPPNNFQVKNQIVKALLEAIFDVLDFDGKRSIIEFARLDYLKDELPTNGGIPYTDFLKLVEAMNILLAYSNKVMYEIGRKFAFYFSPFGTHLVEFVELVQKNLLNNMQIEINYPSKNKIEIKIYSCPFCRGLQTYLVNKDFGQEKKETKISNTKGINTGFTCQFMKGVLEETIKNSANLNVEVKVVHKRKTEDYCLFEAFLIEKETPKN